jgi:hypothetical protein
MTRLNARCYDKREQLRRDTIDGVSALAEAIAKLREEAVRAGADKLPKSTVTAEIRAVRRSRARRSPTTSN